MFWVSLGGPLARSTAVGQTAMVGPIFDAEAEGEEEKVAPATKMLDQERSSFIENLVNDSFLRASLTQVLLVPNASYCKNIASFL